MSDTGPARAVRHYVRREVSLTVHGDQGLHLERYSGPPGDPGLFGPDSVTWRVHADAPGMLMGGFASLMLQSLHPLAMAGVDQHSDFRRDPIRRLNRTVAYVVSTTFGSTEVAEAAIAHVRDRVHPHIHGTAPDGRPYSASDPHLLTWVHIAEVRCFLAGYERFGAPTLTPAERDRYYRETAEPARRLGARDVPESAAEVARYLRDIRPELQITEAAIEGIHFIRTFGATPLERAASRILMNGAAALLPDWARDPLRLGRSDLARLLVDRPLAQAAGRALRWAMEPSDIVGAAYERMGRTPPGRRER
ncbi:oxygenase MpaB family protein [Catenulispora subtropica]|uniref:Oxygenase MpaB family protein n=1 Tax=Catenulispora subtropica TaxID=450798 RepID=A0ABP5ERA1_9ACTN